MMTENRTLLVNTVIRNHSSDIAFITVWDQTHVCQQLLTFTHSFTSAAVKNAQQEVNASYVTLILLCLILSQCYSRSGAF